MSDPYRTPPSEDLYALYLRAYFASLTDLRDNLGANDTRQLQAVLLAIEDAMNFKANAEGKIEVERVGYRERWRVLELIEEYEAAKCRDEND